MSDIPRSSGGGLLGVVRGRITQAGAVAGSYKVKIPRIHGDAELGPFQTITSVPALNPGDRCALLPVEGRSDDFIIIGKLS